MSLSISSIEISLMDHVNSRLTNLYDKYSFPQENKEPIICPEKPSLLVIDDDSSLRRGLTSFFLPNYDVHTANSGPQGLELLRSSNFHCVILDIKMKEMDGFAVHDEIKKISPDLPVIFHTAFQSEHDLKAIINKYRPAGYTDKGDAPENLARIVRLVTQQYLELCRTAVSVSRLQSDLDKHKRDNFLLRQQIEEENRFENIVGASDPIQEAIQLCKRASRSDISVCIQGETGTGKELFSRAIHVNSSRRNKAFVVQNCASLPDPLLHSELFGHEKGAFTGAVAAKKGLFETADGGTILLDEVGDMSPAMQMSLLRVLEEGEIKPLGSSVTKQVNVRIISATNASLEQMVEKKIFREDLYYRLNVFPIPLPPLRERSGDIPLLVKYFLQSENKVNPEIIRIDHQAVHCLEQYSFPGNIRELRNEIERAIAMVDYGDCIALEHLSKKITRQNRVKPVVNGNGESLHEMVATFEKGIISRVYRKCNGNKTQTAQKLGLSRFGLQKKIERYGIRLDSSEAA